MIIPKETKEELVAVLIALRKVLEERDDPIFWPWMETHPDNMQNANRFMAWVILDYQMPVNTVIQNVTRLDVRLGQPERLFNAITDYPLDEWNSKWKKWKTHRFPKAHERLWTIGERIRFWYDGDARRIWTGRTAEEVQGRLEQLKLGDQLSHMLVGALLDLGLIEGSGNVKADTHVCRVIGRLLAGYSYTSKHKDQVIRITQELFPDNPWLLDRPLFMLGRSFCRSQRPECEICPLNHVCTYNKQVTERRENERLHVEGV